ncbi:MAG: DUF819 family protein [Bacteroidales bacterium]|nr:DUF819 family protein [Bacteroidales bacterium]
MKKIGTIMTAYTIGILLALFNLVPAAEIEGAKTSMGIIQNWIMNITVPLAIPLMLFSSDFKLWAKSLPKTFVVLGTGVCSVVIAVILGFLIFKNSGITDFANVSAMMVGIYTGGTMNFFALGQSLNVDQNMIVLAQTFEMLATFPFIVFIIAGGYKIFRKWLPSKDEATVIDETLVNNINATSFENYDGMLQRNTFGKMMIGLLLSIGMLAVGAGLSFLLTGKLNELVIILTITTLAIAASFSPKVRALPKTFELGMFFILIFSVVVASQFDIYSINMSIMSLFYFILFVMITTVILHFLCSKIFKVGGDLFLVGNIALLCSPPFIPPIVGAMGNKKVLISGIVIGLVGYAVGTYLGISLSLLLNLF